MAHTTDDKWHMAVVAEGERFMLSGTFAQAMREAEKAIKREHMAGHRVRQDVRMGTVIKPSDWDKLVVPRTKQDFAIVQAVEAGLPTDWMTRPPQALLIGGAMIGVRYERAAVANTIRDQVIFAPKPSNIIEIMQSHQELSRLVGLFDQLFLDIANDIEAGTVQ